MTEKYLTDLIAFAIDEIQIIIRELKRHAPGAGDSNVIKDHMIRLSRIKHKIKKK